MSSRGTISAELLRKNREGFAFFISDWRELFLCLMFVHPSLRNSGRDMCDELMHSLTRRALTSGGSSKQLRRETVF